MHGLMYIKKPFCTYLYVPIFLFFSSVCYLPFCPTGYVNSHSSAGFPVVAVSSAQATGGFVLGVALHLVNFSDPFFASERSVNIQYLDERCVLGRPWVDPWSVRIQFQALPHMQPALRSTDHHPPSPTYHLKHSSCSPT